MFYKINTRFYFDVKPGVFVFFKSESVIRLYYCLKTREACIKDEVTRVSPSVCAACGANRVLFTSTHLPY